MAEHGAGGHVCGTLGNQRHARDLAALGCTTLPRPSGIARLTQRHQQFAVQGSARQHLQHRLDGLYREVCSHVVRILAFEAPDNLFGRAAQGQGSTTLRGRRGWLGRAAASVCAEQAREGWPLAVLRAASRLTVLEASPRLTVFGTQVPVAYFPIATP